MTQREAGMRWWRWGLWLALALALIPTGQRIAGWVAGNPLAKPGAMTFYDFRIFRSQVIRLEQTGVLYETERSDFFQPSSPVYKFPPTYAAMLTALRDLNREQATRVALCFNFALLAATLAILLLDLRPPAWLAALIALVFINWQPFWESLAGLQLEPLILLLLTLSFLALRRGPGLLAGVPIGVAAALKVYPAALLLYFVLRRQWRVACGILLGGSAAIVLSALVLDPKYWVEFFVRILPHLGGTTLCDANIGALGTFARLAILIIAGPARLQEATQDIRTLVSDIDIPGALPLAQALFAFAVMGLVIGSILALRASAARAGRRRDSLGLALAVCLLVFLMPTSWPDYQAVLILPLIAILVAGARPRRAPGILVPALLALLAGTLLDANGAFYTTHHALASLARLLVPLLLWLAALFALRERSADEEARALAEAAAAAALAPQPGRP
jgi:hypothetical protein